MVKTGNGFDGPDFQKKELLLAIDVGNTNITFGVFRGETIEHQWRIETNRTKTSDEYGIELEQILLHFGYHRGEFKDVIFSSVVPDLAHQMEAMSNRYLRMEPLIVGHGTKIGINIRVDQPKQLGADRVVNVVAGHALYGGPLIVVDLGTAIKHDVVTAKGDYLGGTIAPGIGIATDALFFKTSKLPKIELQRPERVIGRNTIEAMRSGIIHGYLGLVNTLTEQIIDEMIDLGHGRPKVLATGGFASLITANAKHIDYFNRDLTLMGLRVIYDRTKKERE